MKKGKRKDDTVFLGADVPVELRKSIIEIAEKRGKELKIRYTTSDVVRIALSEFVERETKVNAKK